MNNFRGRPKGQWPVVSRAHYFMGLWRLIFKLSLCLVAVSSALPAQADSYYDNHEQGWHWYGDPAKAAAPAAPPATASQQMAAVREAVQEALGQATLDPTPQNVKNYMALQKAVSDQASKFAEVWQGVLVSDPALDYSLSHPTSEIGQQVYAAQQEQDETAAIRQLARHSGLFFFYRSTCPYCQRFAPIVKAFSEKYGISVVPITTDGVALPSFPNSQVDHGQAATFGVQVEPALFTVDPYTHQAVPVSYGLTTEDELRQRVLAIATQKGAAP